MSLATLMVQAVTIITPGTRVDDYGDTTIDWLTATETSTNGWLAQTSSVDDLDGRNATSTLFTLTVPAGTVVTALSRIRIAGRLHEVAAEPLQAWTPRGVHHVEVLLRVVDG